MNGATWWAPRAWLPGGWADGVRLQVGADGCWAGVESGVAPAVDDGVLSGPVLPGLVDAHSHAFQRAFAGLAERLDPAHGGDDDFWSWRDRMYAVALRITPGQMQAIAAHLFHELLAGGYTQVCEFHYLHHAEDGRPCMPPAAMCEALAAAAAEAGIGLTLLPALYERAGFAQPTLRHDQRRFDAGLQRVLELRDAVRAWREPLVSAGVAVHSLRAASPASLRDLARAVADDVAPLHIHIAEQVAEVQDCLATTGARPIEWLARELPLDERWQLVHATHATPAEIGAVAASGAGVVLCPGTEANLGDGLCDLPRWLAAGVPLAVGSDSQVSRDWPGELRLLEYGQRLALRHRNVAASRAARAPAPHGAQADARHGSAGVLFTRMLEGGRAAAGLPCWGLQRGARADLVVVDEGDDALLGLPADQLLDGLVFAAPARPFVRTLVAGRWTGAQRTACARRFAAAMAALWAAA